MKNPIPSDATEASAIAAELNIPTVRVTRAHRAGLIEGWNVLGGKPRYSLAEVKRVVLCSGKVYFDLLHYGWPAADMAVLDGGATVVVADAALAVEDDALGSFVPGLAMASSRHETQYSRLFRS